MKLNKKGFTLVELLAVIVVLAIIALIGYTVVGDAITNAQYGADARTLESFSKELQTQCLLLKQSNKLDLSTTDKTTATVSTIHTNAKNAFSNKNYDFVAATDVTVDASCNITITSPLTKNGTKCTKQTNGGWTCEKAS